MQGNPFDQFDGAKPAGNPFDQFDHPLMFDSSGLLDAAAKGFAQGLSTPLDPETVQSLRDAGIFNDFQKGQHSIIRTFNEALVNDVVDPLFNRIPRAVYGAIRGMAEAEPSDLAGKGISALAGAGAGAMEAFPAGHFTGFPSPVPVGEPQPEAVSPGTEPAIEALRPRGIESPTERVLTPAEAPPETGQPSAELPTEATPTEPPSEPAPQPDIHSLARQIDPETFSEYDALSARKDTFRRWLGELSDGRAQSDRAQALQGQIDDILGKVNGVEDRLTKSAAQRLQAARDSLEDYLRTDTPDMQRVRHDLQETDYRMRDLAPDVSAAYRKAAEQMPPEPDAVAPEPAETPPEPQEAAPVAQSSVEAAPEPTPQVPPAPQPEPAPAVSGPAVVEPVAPTRPMAAPLPEGIAGDVAKQLVAAGRPADEAEAAGALIQAHYEARAERFAGAKGSAEDLYRTEAPAVRAGRGVEPALEYAQKGEMDQVKRGKIRLATNDARAAITLFKDADASTFIHETGHHWLDELSRDAGDPEAPPDVRADMAAVHQWLGTEPGQEIPTRAHEKFARGFERYMMEGHAPSARLAGVFAKFRDWLTKIYETVARLRSPINDDIRGVFDRMLASKNEGEPAIAPEPKPVREFVTDRARGESVYRPVPREPMRLIDWIKRNGGLRDDTFARRVNTARGRADARANPTDIRRLADNPAAKGLIKARTGMAHDEAALRAWEEGYFPDHAERPDINDLYDAIEQDLSGAARYSKHDAAAVSSFRDAINHNAELDRLANAMGVNPREMSREQFFDMAAEHLSLEERAREIGSLDAETEREIEDARARAREFAESRGDAWEPDAVYAGTEPRTMEDLERAYEHERTAAAEAGGSEGRTVDAGPSTTDTGHVQAGVRQGGHGAGATGRGSAGAGEGAEVGSDGRFEPAGDRFVDKAGNVRLDNIETPEDFKQAIRDAAERNGDFLGRRRGIVSDQQRDALADVLGTTPDKILGKEIGESFSDSEIKMLEKTLAQSTGHVRSLAEKFAQTGSEADDMALAEAILRHDMIQGLYSQATAEAGRAFRALRRTRAYWSNATSATERALRNNLDDTLGRTFNQRLALAKKLAALDDPGQVSRLVRDSQRPGLFDWIQSAFVNALLSGPFTHLGYTAAGEMFGLFRATAEAGTAAGVGAVREALGYADGDRARLGEVRAQLYGQMRGSWRGIKAAWTALKENQTVLPEETEQSPGLPGMQGQAVGARQIIPGKVGTVLEAPSRLVAALHSFNWTTFYEQSKAAQAFRIASGEGFTGDALSARVARLVDQPTEDMIRQASEDATGGALMTRPNYDSLMGTLSRFTNWGVELPDMKLPGGLTLPLGTLRPIKFIDPFIQIQANVQKAAFGRNTPFALFSQQVRDDLMMRNGGAAFDRTAGRILAGTAFMAGAGALYFSGRLNPSGPHDPKEAALWRRVHGMPHGFNVGNLSFDMLRLGNLGLQMSVAADLAHAVDRIGKDDATQVASSLVEAFAQNILDESFARGPEGMMKAADDPDRYGAAWIRSFFSSAMPFSVGLGQVAHEIDPNTHRARSMMDAVLAKIPVASESLAPVYDVWGQPVPSRGWVGTYYDHLLNDPVDRHLEELGYSPSPAAKHVNGIELTDQQYADYSRIGGRMARVRVEQAMSQPGFANMPPEYQTKALEHIISGARKQAAGIVTLQSVGTADDINAKRRAASDAAANGASHEDIKRLRTVH